MLWTGLAFGSGAKRLIIHADDAGMSYAVDMATSKALNHKEISSVSVMAPCPWIYLFADQVKDCPTCDVGAHITLTSEWHNYRWSPVSTLVPTLVDGLGNFYPDGGKVLAHAKTEDIEREIEAQIQKLQAVGFKLTHIDMHMGVVAIKAEWIRAYVKIADKYGLVPMLAKWSSELEGHFRDPPVPFTEIKALLQEYEAKGRPMLDHLIADVGGRGSPEERKQAYIKAIKGIKPGVTQIIVHLAEESDEYKATINSRPHERRRFWDAAILADPEIRKLIADQGIQLTTWRELGAK